MDQKIEFNTAIPLYYQLKEIIKQQIEEKVFTIGGTIPTEQELQEKYKVSRSTVRQAISELVNEGCLIKKQGRGTFVSGMGKLKEELPRLLSFTEQILAKGIKPETRVISVEEISPPKRITKALRLKEKEKVLRIERLRLADKKAICILVSYLPFSLGIKIEDDFTGSLYDLLEKKYGFAITKGDEIIEASAANRHEARLLKIKEGSPVLCMNRVTYTLNKRPLELVEGTYRADRYKYSITLER